MGIDAQFLNFLRYTKKYGDFKRTVTLGRLNINFRRQDIKHLNHAEYQDLIKYIRRKEIYVDDLLKDYFGASIVDSIDKSEYEGATIIFDMNNEILTELKGKYDTVINGGTLEHIFNIPQALENISSLCKPGGEIIQALPANNQCGHGFWQMSPELFFTLYSDKNGYRDTEVFVGRQSDPNNFYKVIRPKNGKRVNIYSKDEVYIYVRTIRKETEFSHKDVQQSDYVNLWNKQDRLETGIHYRLENFVHSNDSIFKIAKKIYLPYYRSVNTLSRRNRNLVKVNFDRILLK